MGHDPRRENEEAETRIIDHACEIINRMFREHSNFPRKHLEKHLRLHIRRELWLARKLQISDCLSDEGHEESRRLLLGKMMLDLQEKENDVAAEIAKMRADDKK
jgi:hypothetical protein